MAKISEVDPRFSQVDSTAPNLYMRDDNYQAWVTVLVGGSWSWTVWLKGTALEGRSDWDMDARQACREAADALARLKAADARPYFADTV